MENKPWTVWGDARFVFSEYLLRETEIYVFRLVCVCIYVVDCVRGKTHNASALKRQVFLHTSLSI